MEDLNNAPDLLNYVNFPNRVRDHVSSTNYSQSTITTINIINLRLTEKGLPSFYPRLSRIYNVD